MDADVRRRAVRQTMRVVFGASVLSCSHEHARTEVEIKPLPSSTATSAPVATVRPPTLAGACEIATDETGAITKASLKCCLDATRAATKGNASFSAGSKWATERPDLAACCQAIAKTGDMMSLAYSEAWDYHACYACTDVVGNRGACTPWGPPMPPPMV